MFASAPSVRLRLGALVLLASVLPLAVHVPPAAVTDRGAAAAHPAAWLRAQVASGVAGGAQEDAPLADFERAVAEARAADARTLHGFLAAFLGAHARLTGTEAVPTDGRSSHALMVELREQLARAGLDVRPPLQAGAPPAVPQQWARWAAASLLVPRSSDRVAATGAQTARHARFAWPPTAAAAAWQRVAAPLTRGTLARILFSGRRLGP